MKLSTIWYKANRELDQCHGVMGTRSSKRACAYGAIFYYDAKNKSNENLCKYSVEDMKQSKYLKDAIPRFNIATGKDIVSLNDCEHWTFLEFARKARELGL